MKYSVVLPLVATVVGFCLGWLVKPQSEPVITQRPLATSQTPKAPAKPALEPPVQPPPGPALRPGAAGKPDAEFREKAGTARNSAKMLRFAEALGLSAAQQEDLTQLIDGSLKPASTGQAARPVGAGEVLDQFAARAAALEQGLAKLLTPEQSAAFAELRQRERDNRVETTAQRELGNLTEVTDLTAEQRDKVLALLRTSSAAEAGAIPPSLALILDSSVLPLGSDAPSAQSIENLSQLAAALAPGDPAAPHAKLIENQRRELDERLNRLKDVLTPAQVAQYRAAIAEQHAIQDTMMPPQR